MKSAADIVNEIAPPETHYGSMWDIARRKMVTALEEVRYSNEYRVFWSEEDQEWVAIANSLPGISCLDKTPVLALAGVIDILVDMNKRSEIPDSALFHFEHATKA